MKIAVRMESVCAVVDDSDGPELTELLGSGQTSSVIKLLMTWLHQATVYLAEDQPVSGTVDIVSQLITEHQVRLDFTSNLLSVKHTHTPA